MIKIRGKRAHFMLPFLFCGLLFTLGSSCWNRPTNTTPSPETKNSNAQNSPSPESDQSKSTEQTNQPLTESDPALVQDEAWIFEPHNIVNLTRKGTNTPVAMQIDFIFNLGDLLEVGDASNATAVCPKKGTCLLGPGNYNSCCTVPCQGQVSMIRRENASDLPIIPRVELPADEAAKLNVAEKGLRELNLGPVTTQFLITTLYTNWRIKEANQELDKLSVQLTNPEAKQELQQLYAPAVTRTGNMHLKYNRPDDATKMYQLTLDRSSVNDDPRARAAAHIGLAQTAEIKGDKTEAVNNLENAKQIYVKQGDQNAASATDKQIEKTRAIRKIDTIKTTRPLVERSPQP